MSETEELSAGRELDIRVHEAVFKERVLLNHHASINGQPMVGANGIYSTLPYYSSNISVAWQVLRHLERDGWEWEMRSMASGHVIVNLRHPSKSPCGGVAPYPAYAICLAALRAVEHLP